MCKVHSDSSLELGYHAGSVLHMKDLLVVGSNQQMVILSCTGIPGRQLHCGKSWQLAVVAAFSAGCGAWLVDVVEAVLLMAVASCHRIAGVRHLPAVMQHDLSRAVPVVLSLAVLVVGVEQRAAAAAAVVVVVACRLALLLSAR